MDEEEETSGFLGHRTKFGLFILWVHRKLICRLDGDGNAIVWFWWWTNCIHIACSAYASNREMSWVWRVWVANTQIKFWPICRLLRWAFSHFYSRSSDDLACRKDSIQIDKVRRLLFVQRSVNGSCVSIFIWKTFSLPFKLVNTIFIAQTTRICSKTPPDTPAHTNGTEHFPFDWL